MKTLVLLPLCTLVISVAACGEGDSSGSGGERDGTGGSAADGSTGGLGGDTGQDEVPPGVTCSEHPVCAPSGNDECEAPRECMNIRGCATPLCIAREQACEQTCGDQGGCGFQTSAPPTIICEYKTTPGHD